MLAALPFLVEVCYLFVAGVWEAELLRNGMSRLYRVCHGDDVDKHCAQYFVNSSLSPVLLFRRRLKSKADVLKGIRNKGFTQSRWDALLGFWDAVCRHGPCGLLSPLHPWDSGFLRIFMASKSGCFDSLELLNDFLKQVVVFLVGILEFVSGLGCSGRILVLGRMFGFGLNLFLLLLSLLLRVLKLSLLGFWLSLTPLMLSFARPGCLFSVGLVIPSSLLISSWILLVISCLKSLIWIFLGFLGGICKRLLGLKGLLLVVWMGGHGMKLRLFRCPGFLVLLFFWELVESAGTWPQGLSDAFFAMIPKADGDSTPLGQRPLSVLPVVYRLWASPRLGHLREWVEGLPESVYSLGNGLSSVEAWFSTALDVEEVLSGTGGDQLHVSVADVIKSFDAVDRSILDCALGRLGLPDWFRKVYCSFNSQVRIRF